MRKALLCFMAAALLFSSVSIAVAEEMAKPKIARAAGDEIGLWEAKVVGTSDVVKSDSLSGDYALLFVNASCASCRAELAAIKTMEYSNLDIFLVSVDFDPARVISTYREALGVTYPILDGSDLKLSEMFATSSTPTSVIASGGKLKFKSIGYGGPKKEKVKNAFGAYKK